MKQQTVLTNTTLRIKSRIRDFDGELVDPQSIQFEIKGPNDTSYTVYTIGSIVKESVGIYYIDITFDTPGRFDYSWFTYGNVTASWKGFFQVEDARYV
jgi:hypothetical protein